jgi:hypothetical protein
VAHTLQDCALIKEFTFHIYLRVLPALRRDIFVEILLSVVGYLHKEMHKPKHTPMKAIDVCVTVHRGYNNIISPLDATMLPAGELVTSRQHRQCFISQAVSTV